MTLPNENKPIQGPMRILVIQLARLGDTLQSLMALRAAKELYPQLEIHFLVRDRFSDAAKRVPWIQEVIGLPTEKVISTVLSGKNKENQALQDLAQWMIPLVEKPWDMIVNWSFSESSSYLTSILPGRVKLGYTRRKDSSFVAADGWSYYFQGIVQEKIRQDIHITDILTTQLLTALQIHVGDPAPNGEAEVTSKYFFSLAIKQPDLHKLPKNTTRRWLGVQLSSQQSPNAWKAHQWAKLVQTLVENHPEYGVFLLGAPEDKNTALEVENLLPQSVRESEAFVSLVGQTDFDLWASIISTCQWLIASSHAAIHLGAVLGTRVLYLSFEGNPFYEAGPYGNGHYILSVEPQEATATQEALLTSEAVYSTWIYGNNEWRHGRKISIEEHFQIMGGNPLAPQMQVYRSQIRQTQDGGGVRYESLLSRPVSLEAWTAQVIGYMARSWYCGWVPEMGREMTRETIAPAFIKKLRDLQESIDVLSKIYEKAHRTASLIHQKSSSLKSEKLMGIQDQQELKSLAASLLQLDELTEKLTRVNPTFSCFLKMSKVLMHSAGGDHISEISKESAKSYKQLNQGVALFKDWIQFTLKLVKPVALQTIPRLEPARLPSPEITPETL